MDIPYQTCQLKTYYNRIFPTELFCKWLSYGNEETLSNREFSFTLEDDVYVRYLSFNNKNEFHTELTSKVPKKIDIGAYYNIPPSLRRKAASGTMVPEWKEFVFDIDMTDYDDVRFCCEKAEICSKCWTLMRVAMKILDQQLREAFGYEHILWVYSGRRGIHCWVCDDEARKLNFNARDAFIHYLSVVSPGSSADRNGKKVRLKLDDRWADNGRHPVIVTGLDVINQYFIQYFCHDQCVPGTANGLQRVLGMLPEGDLKDRLKREGAKGSQVEEEDFEMWWNRLLESLELDNQGNVIDEIKLEFMYPRFDMNVTKGVNHLLKSPFSVHPGTGRICVPIDFNEVDDFDPLSVPTLTDVLDELRLKKNVKETSLGKYFDIYENFLASCCKDLSI